MTDQEKIQAEAMAQIKAAYDDGYAEINCREYQFSTTTHKKRRSIFAFLSKVQGLMNDGDMSWIDWPEFTNGIEPMLCDLVMVDGMQISKVKSHWEQFPEDYILFVTTSLTVFAYPFMRGRLGD